MADRTPTRFNRLQAGDHVTSAGGDIEAFGEAILSQRALLTAANTAGNPAKFTITGQFQVQDIAVGYTSALTTTSALSVNVGISTNATAFVAFSVTAGNANKIDKASTPFSARAANWVSLGSAAAVTTVHCMHSAASVRSDLSAQVTFNYIVRG